jgi:FAD/FMN-containing dehydrogenase
VNAQDGIPQHGPQVAALLSALARIVSEAHVHSSDADRLFYSTDSLGTDAIAAAAITPGSTDEVSHAVAACTRAGVAVIPRGAGLSYTGGYTPAEAGGIVFDLQRLDRIVEINAEDMFVTVETGCSWKQLLEALEPFGVRTPYWGPVSGHSATVGGALSQGSIYYGSARHGSTADSVLGLQVVLADGRCVTTGSGSATVAASPFFRNFGPDLTGIFLNDSGALGLKTRATLRLIRRPPATDFLSFSFENHRQCTRVLSEICRRGLASECYVFDPFMHGLRLKRDSLVEDFRRLVAVARAGKTLVSGARDAARIAVTGRGAFKDVQYAMHVMLEARSEAIVRAELAEAREIATAGGGREIEATLPRVQRSDPFFSRKGNGTLNPEGQRYLPVHGICPHSRANAVIEAVHDVFSRFETQLEGHRVEWGYVLCGISTHAVIVEPLIFWADAPSQYHERVIEPDYLAGLPRHAPNDAGTALVKEISTALKGEFLRLGCTHLQIGRSYPYRAGRDPQAYALLQSIKRAVDPDGRVNPGSLGLD